MKTTKKIIAFFLSVLMLFTMVSNTAFAVTAEETTEPRAAARTTISIDTYEYEVGETINSNIKVENYGDAEGEIKLSVFSTPLAKAKKQTFSLGEVAVKGKVTKEFSAVAADFSKIPNAKIREILDLVIGNVLPAVFRILSIFFANVDCELVKIGNNYAAIVAVASVVDNGEVEEPAEPEAPTDPDVVDTDKDGISDEDEAIYGTDINKADTDDDGYTDFEELFLMGTDPLKTDEKDVDTDGDGLTDYDEVKKYGTDINSEDTDSDGLTDYDEVNRYNTDPTKKDTDGDGLSDAFEIENGLDPLKVSTDGKTNDGDVKIEQTTSEESVSDALLDEENVAKPSLEGEVAGDLSEKVFIGTSPDCSLDDNRAVIGEPIVVDGEEDYVDDLKLMFDLSGYEGALENLSICKLDEDGNIVPVESEIEGSSISCGAEADATYFVMDIDAFLKALGVDLDGYKATTFSLRGRSATVAGDKISGQADIVFVIDTTGSMSDEIYNVIYNVTDFTERLATEYNVKVNYALIDYRDLEEDGPGTTKVIKNGFSNWFSDVSTYITALNKLRASGGGDTPECAVDALETARRLDFRKSASKFVILITDANYKVKNDYGVKSMQEEAEKLAADGINASVVTSSSYKSTYNAVYETTGGIYANVYGNFSAELLKLADLIGEETSDGEWVILKHGYRYVKLPAIPTADSTADTDEDGISDYKELGKKVTVDLTQFIKAQLANNGVPFEAYTGKTSVEVYDSIADPTLYDTDSDGFGDGVDTTPWQAKAFANMYYYITHKYGDKPSVTLMVKQPIVGSRTAVNFGGGDLVGHSFIMLSDGKDETNIVGFYPSFEKTVYVDYIDYTIANIYSRGLLDTNGVLVDDTTHEYNITYSASITSEQYNKVYNYISNNSNTDYNLQSYNCTTFAVEAFSAGKSVKNIVKKHLWSIPVWAGGATLGVFYPYGYDPGDAGEDIRNNASQYTIIEKIILADGTDYNAVVEKHRGSGGGGGR